MFLCRDKFEPGLFTGMNNTGGSVDVWAVTGIDEHALITTDAGYSYFPARMPRRHDARAGWPPDEAALPAHRRQHEKAAEETSGAGK